MQKSSVMAGLAVASMLVLPVFFQNCSKATFDMTDESIFNELYSTFGLVDMTISVEMNRPKDFDAAWTGNKGSLVLTTVDNGNQPAIRTAHGQVQIRSGRDFQVTYTPDPFFRGEDQVKLYVVDALGQGGKEPSIIKFQVGNHLNFLKPALALRGSSCTLCHAQVASNLITDLGFGSYFLETGRPAGITNPNYGFYTDHAFDGDINGKSGTLSTINLAATSEVIVPKADLVGYLKNTTGETTLAGYFRKRLLASSYPNSRAAANNVREAKKVFIGAPTSARILSVFQATASAGSSKFIPDQAGLALTGLPAAVGGQFIVSGTLRCDGDLLLQGGLHLNAATIETNVGCRIYALGSIFISNGLTINSINGGNDHNVQLISARAVGMGLGNTMTAGGTQICETSGWYQGRFASGIKDNYTKSSTETHFNLHQETSYTRAYGAGDSAKLFLDSVIAETLPLNMKDATCEAGGRGRTFSRLLIVAPRVDSRYNGNFSGSIIAETSVLSIGSFKFSFDPVFERVAILPLLGDADFLSVED